MAAYFSWGMSIQPHLRGLPVVVPNSPPTVKKMKNEINESEINVVSSGVDRRKEMWDAWGEGGGERIEEEGFDELLVMSQERLNIAT